MAVDDTSAEYSMKVTLGTSEFPLKNNSVDIILCNYLLMFLGRNERSVLYREINRIAAPGCLFIVEVYPAKDSYYPTLDAVRAFKNIILKRLCRDRWEIIKNNKDRFIVKRKD